MNGILLFISFVMISIAVDRNLLASIDRAAGFWVQAHITPSRTRLMFLWTDLASAWLVLPATLGLGIVLALCGKGDWVKRLAWTVPGCMLSVEFVKYLFQRARPVVPHPLLELATYSFPSGHVASAMAFYGFVAVLICSLLKRRVGRVLVLSAAATVITGVAFSRVYLGVHYITDVIGGAVLGLAWLSAGQRSKR